MKTELELQNEKIDKIKADLEAMIKMLRGDEVPK